MSQPVEEPGRSSRDACQQWRRSGPERRGDRVDHRDGDRRVDLLGRDAAEGEHHGLSEAIHEVAPVEPQECGMIMQMPMIDSGAHSSVCPPSYGSDAPTTHLQSDMQLVTVTGTDIKLHGCRSVPTRVITVSGEMVEEDVEYMAADVRKTIQAVADILDAGGEVHFGKVSWITKTRRSTT